MEKEKKGIKKAKKKVSVPETGERIKERRRKLHMTQEQLAEAVYMNPKTISAIENGRRNPSLETVESIAKVLDVDRDYLLGKTDFPSIEAQKFANFANHINKHAKITNLIIDLFDYSKYKIMKCSYDLDDNLINIDDLPFITFDSDELETMQIINQNSFYAIKDSEGNLFHFTNNEYNELCYELIDYLNFMIKHKLPNKTPLLDKITKIDKLV